MSMTDFKKFKEQLPSKEKFYSSLPNIRYEHDHIRFGANLKWKR